MAHGQVGTQAQCSQGQRYCCLQHIKHEAMRERGGRARLTPCCQLIAPHSSVMRTACTFVGTVGMRSSVSAEGGAGRASSKLGAASTRGEKPE